MAHELPDLIDKLRGIHSVCVVVEAALMVYPTDVEASAADVLGKHASEPLDFLIDELKAASGKPAVKAKAARKAKSKTTKKRAASR